ncbi:MAG: hypothetical protein F9K16_01975 [Thermoanaerobaculia bacterium]|nr:MAG: hypothetical protein F9K16_01975 [Thermoanaerobaculia bacterium]
MPPRASGRGDEAAAGPRPPPRRGAPRRSPAGRPGGSSSGLPRPPPPRHRRTARALRSTCRDDGRGRRAGAPSASRRHR